MKDFLNAFNTADTSIGIAKATVNTLVQAYNSDDSVDRDDAQMVLLGIMENMRFIQNCIYDMFNAVKAQKEGVTT